MAAASTVIAASSMAFSVGKGIHDMSAGASQASSAQDKIDNYKRQELKNSYAGLSVPTQGAEFAKEQTMQTQAEMAYVLGSRGTQGAMGGAFSLADSTRQSTQEISSQLTDSEFRMNQLMAEEESRIRGIQERREEQDLQGLGAERAAGYARRDAGSSRITSTLASGANLAMGMGDFDNGGDDSNGGGNEENQYSFNPNVMPGPDPGNFKIKMPDTNMFPETSPWQQRTELKNNQL